MRFIGTWLTMLVANSASLNVLGRASAVTTAPYLKPSRRILGPWHAWWPAKKPVRADDSNLRRRPPGEEPHLSFGIAA
jgi:hypothetical protein